MTDVFARRAAEIRAINAHAAHKTAVAAQLAYRAKHSGGPRRFAASLRDWGGSNNTPPAHWRKVDARATSAAVAVTYLAEFDAVTLSASAELLAYAGTPDAALAQIAALVALREDRS